MSKELLPELIGGTAQCPNRETQAMLMASFLSSASFMAGRVARLVNQVGEIRDNGNLILHRELVTEPEVHLVAVPDELKDDLNAALEYLQFSYRNSAASAVYASRINERGVQATAALLATNEKQYEGSARTCSEANAEKLARLLGYNYATSLILTADPSAAGSIEDILTPTMQPCEVTCLRDTFRNSVMYHPDLLVVTMSPDMEIGQAVLTKDLPSWYNGNSRVDEVIRRFQFDKARDLLDQRLTSSKWEDVPVPELGRICLLDTAEEITGENEHLQDFLAKQSGVRAFGQPTSRVLVPGV